MTKPIFKIRPLYFSRVFAWSRSLFTACRTRTFLPSMKKGKRDGWRGMRYVPKTRSFNTWPSNPGNLACTLTIGSHGDASKDPGESLCSR